MSARRLRAAIALLSLLGSAIAAYVVYARYSGASIACTTGGCEVVQDSRYATVIGIPVAVLGVVGYAALIVSAATPGATAASAGVGLAAAGLAFSGYLLYAQLALIHAVCQWCVTSDVVFLLVATATLWRFSLEHRQPRAGPDRRGVTGTRPGRTHRSILD